MHVLSASLHGPLVQFSALVRTIRVRSCSRCAFSVGVAAVSTQIAATFTPTSVHASVPSTAIASATTLASAGGGAVFCGAGR